MAKRQWFCLHLSPQCGFFLLYVFPVNGLLALGSFEAGTASFTPLSNSSFWTSTGGNFTFGFQAVNGGTDYLLSIWVSNDPDKLALWWPPPSGVDADPTVKDDASFKFTSKGSLELYSSNGSLLWSTKTSSSHAQLNETGNLMLFDPNNPSKISWQSFEDRRDSLMLAGLDGINVTDKSSLLQSRRNQSSYAKGGFRLQTVGDSKVHLYGQDYLGHDFKYAEEEMNAAESIFQIGNSQNRYNDQDQSETVRRLTLEYDGNLKIYHWNYFNKSWDMARWQIFQNPCQVGSPCGPFGICYWNEADGSQICSCPAGYTPKAADDHSQGCENSISSSFISKESCINNSTGISVEEVADTDFFFNDMYVQSDLIKKDECKAICSNDCKCMAAVYSKSGNSTCYVKGNTTWGYLMNGYHTVGKILYIKAKIPKKNHKIWVIGVAAAVLLVVLGFGAFLIVRRRRNHAHNPVLRFRGHKPKYEVTGDAAGPIRFYRHHELVHATANFSEPLGKGGFGTVFKGWLAVENTGFDSTDTQTMDIINMGDNVNQQMRHAVAVKVLRGFEGKSNIVDESYSQFKAEINTLGKIHHVNLVSLLGYSYTTSAKAPSENTRMLVYECMEGGSLDTYLSPAQHTKPKLAWRTRYSIALGIARGIAYLHHDCSPPILHCDIKPHNILLDANFIAKVADFGFARRIQPQSHIILSSVRGTHGYLAPEWLTNGELTFKMDVYSFGKLLLELVRGFKIRSDDFSMPLVEWAIECMSVGVVTEFAGCQDVEDVKGSSECISLPHQDHDSQQEAMEKLRLLKVGLWCIQHNASTRPTMLRAVQLIEGSISSTMEDPPIPSTSLQFAASSSQSLSTRTYHDGSLSGR